MAESRLKRWIDKVLCKELITGPDGEDNYLHRWWLMSLPREQRVYLHRFIGSDWTPVLHDHPKWFISIGLIGGYVEETTAEPRPSGPINSIGTSLWLRNDGFKRLKRIRWVAPWVRFFPSSHIHRLRCNRKRVCWTIIITGPLEREWGFWPDGKWVPWKEYLGMA